MKIKNLLIIIIVGIALLGCNAGNPDTPNDPSNNFADKRAEAKAKRDAAKINTSAPSTTATGQ